MRQQVTTLYYFAAITLIHQSISGPVLYRDNDDDNYTSRRIRNYYNQTRNRVGVSSPVYFARPQYTSERTGFRSSSVTKRRSFVRRTTHVPIVFPSSNSIITTVATPTEPPPRVKKSRSKENSRERVLLPDVNSEGVPVCASSPMDTFCENVTNYPKIDLKQEIRFSDTEFRDIFGENSIDGRKAYADDHSSEERVCKPIPKLIYPKMAKNEVNQWVFVVNDEQYTQAVVSEVCEKEGKACAYLDQNLPPGVYSRCRQKYAYKRLLALHPTERKTYTDTFQFPSCCACYIKTPFGRSKS